MDIQERLGKKDGEKKSPHFHDNFYMSDVSTNTDYKDCQKILIPISDFNN